MLDEPFHMETSQEAIASPVLTEQQAFGATCMYMQVLDLFSTCTDHSMHDIIIKFCNGRKRRSFLSPL